jgi:bifunctional non-homologous end joining protein LigD
LIELDGEDVRWQPLERRKSMLPDLLPNVRDGVAFNQHFTGDGAIIFRHACALGCEGIVSKRLGSPYRSGRVDHWLKVKNPAAPAAGNAHGHVAEWLRSGLQILSRPSRALPAHH